MLQAVILRIAVASDRPFNNPANWGGTGLMEIPTARVIDDGAVRFGFSQDLPFRWYSGAIGIFPGMEIGGRLTELTNIEGGIGSDYGNYKDKAFDIKYQILPESKYLPALAVGINDFHGTRLFPSEYIALSRQIFPFDLTIGLGTKRLKGNVTSSLIEDVGVFGGIEWKIFDWVSLMAEYNPIEYENDRIKQAVPEGSESPFNFGLRINALPAVGINLSYQRGTTIGFSCNLQFDLGKPLISKRADPRLWHPVDRRNFDARDSQEMVESIKKAIIKTGLQSVSVYTDGRSLIAEFENTRYLSNQKAAGRVLRILLFHAPKETQTLSMIFKRRQIPFLKVSVEPDYFERYIFDKIPEDDLFERIKVETIPFWNDNTESKIAVTPEENEFGYSYGIKPDFKSYLNDPSGFFKYRLGIKPYGAAALWKGGVVAARFDMPFYSNISSSNIAPPDAVRSNSWEYLGENYTFDYLLFDQTLKLSDKTFGRISAGYLETMYAGIGSEILTFIGDGSIAIGIEGDLVKKRKKESFFNVEDSYKHTLLGNLYYQCHPLDLIFQVQYGRFLAGDTGWKVVASREYDTGAEIGFWYSFTDTNNFSDFNRDYNDKGFFVTIPLNMFTDYETRTKYWYSLSPWTRDVAAQPEHWQTLFGFVSDLMPGSFKSDIKKLKE
jgi:hypothetical protein